MAKVLFFSSSLPSHVYPTLAVVQELVRRGEEVIYYLTDEYEQLIRATGATFRRYETIKYDMTRMRPSRLATDECRFVFPQILEEVKVAQPDYIIYESFCLWGRILGHSLHVPTISCRMVLAENDHFTVFPPIRPGAIALNMLYKYNDLQELNALCEQYHLSPIGLTDMQSFFFPHVDDLNIVFLPRPFQPAEDTFDERFVFVGPCLVPRSEATNELRDSLLAPSDQPTVYISLGTLYNTQAITFYKQCFEAFGGQPWRVILATGKWTDHASLEPIPENFQVHTHVPQLDILQQTDLFVTHGGTNSVMEALYYGVPMIVANPPTTEHKIHARRIAEMGLGIYITYDAITGTALQEAARTVLGNPSFREHTQHMQEAMRAAGGQQRAVDAIFQFLSRQDLSHKRPVLS